MGYWQEFQHFVYAFVGAFVGASLFAWMSGYYSEKGKRKLMKEEWANILAEAHWKAYEEEKAKRLATKEDIDNVLKQVEGVTRVTETTKAEITEAVWERQWHFTQKRDVYARLIDSLEIVDIRLSMLMPRETEEAAGAEARREGIQAIEEFRRARVLADLLLSPAVAAAAHGIVRHLRPVFRSSEPSEQAKISARQSIMRVRGKLIEIGRVELGRSKI